MGLEVEAGGGVSSEQKCTGGGHRRHGAPGGAVVGAVVPAVVGGDGGGGRHRHPLNRIGIGVADPAQQRVQQHADGPCGHGGPSLGVEQKVGVAQFRSTVTASDGDRCIGRCPQTRCIAIVDRKFNGAAGAVAVGRGIAAAAAVVDTAQQALVGADAGDPVQTQHTGAGIKAAADAGTGREAQPITGQGVADRDGGTTEVGVVNVGQAEAGLYRHSTGRFGVSGRAAGGDAWQVVGTVERELHELGGAIGGRGRKSLAEGLAVLQGLHRVKAIVEGVGPHPGGGH